MNIPFDCLEGFCLCEAPVAETTEGGILLPETDGDDGPQLKKLKVVKTGRGEQLDAGRRREVVVEPGGTYYFLFPAYSLGSVITLNGTKYLIVQSKFVCGRALWP